MPTLPGTSPGVPAAAPVPSLPTATPTATSTPPGKPRDKRAHRPTSKLFSSCSINNAELAACAPFNGLATASKTLVCYETSCLPAGTTGLLSAPDLLAQLAGGCACTATGRSGSVQTGEAGCAPRTDSLFLFPVRQVSPAVFLPSVVACTVRLCWPGKLKRALSQIWQRLLLLVPSACAGRGSWKSSDQI